MFYCLGISKGVGFIRFDQRNEAEKAIKELNGIVPDGATDPITVKFANSPSSNKNFVPIQAMAQYLAPTRRFLGPMHPASRFGFVISNFYPDSIIYYKFKSFRIHKIVSIFCYSYLIPC